MNMSVNDWRGEHLIRCQNSKSDALPESVAKPTRRQAAAQSLKQDYEAIRAIASNMTRTQIKNHLKLTTHRIDYVLRLFPEISVIEHRCSPKKRKV